MVDDKEIEVKNDSNESKRLRLDSNETMNILNQFEFVKILNDNCANKLIVIQAVKKANEENLEENANRNAVMIFSKPHFSLDETKALLAINNPTQTYITNDIYKKLSVYPMMPYNNVEVQLIYPATEQHIIKYSSQEFFFLRETYQDYVDITSKYIKNTAFTLDWVYNILEHKKESERIVFEDPDPTNGFILLPDMKWDGKSLNTMSLLAIVHQKGLSTIRDLDSSHLNLLENIRDKSLKAIEEKYSINRNKIRCFLHYQPTFYHLHVHINHLSNDLGGMAERNFALNQIIENLKVDSDYYKKVSIEYLVKKNDKLYELYKDRFE